ncbi:MAG TPA: NAD-dependent epimerase/dehydratase family protein [Trichormus sp.]|jgi:nucleoside-diphosphate-sugar epimerase
MVANGIRKKLLVTGASGSIGRAICERLLASDRYSIKVQVRNALEARAAAGSTVDFTKVQMEEADFTRVGDREMRLLTKGCDTIIHAAGLVHRPNAQYQEYEVINVRATQLLAEAAVTNKVHTLIFLSSSAVYGPGPFENADESSPLKGVTPYAVSKMASEQFLQRFPGIPRVIILRPSLVFGEGDRGNLLGLIRSIKSNKYKHIGAASTEKSVIYSRDVAQVVDLCLSRLPEGFHTLNVANPEPVTVKELTEEIAGALGMPKKLSSVPESVFRIGAKAAGLFMQEKAPITIEQIDKLTTTTTCSVRKLVQSTGFTPRYPLETGLRAEIQWAEANNLI